MFDTDLLVTFMFMAVLFLRQVSILKQANKINYSPLMLVVGTISSVVHFIIHTDVNNILLLLRESLFPLLVALLLYIVMNILHQTQQSENSKTQDEFTKILVNEISDLKKFILELEVRMASSRQEDIQAQEEIRSKFKDDIKALDTIQTNQTHFLDKFDEMEAWHQDVNKDLKYFTQVQLPELDEVVHKHIDILRVAEQDHYNKLTLVLQTAVQSRGDMSEDIDKLKIDISKIKNIADDISDTITSRTMEQLSSVTKEFQTQMLYLKSHAESIKTSLHESENTLGGIRGKSELIMKQMILSSSKMNELEKQNSGLHDVYTSLKEVIRDVEAIKSDYVKSQSQLNLISKDLEFSKDEQIIAMKVKIDDLSEVLSKKIEESLEKLHEHYHIASEDITKSVQVLSKRVQLKKGYSNYEAE